MNQRLAVNLFGVLLFAGSTLLLFQAVRASRAPDYVSPRYPRPMPLLRARVSVACTPGVGCEQNCRDCGCHPDEIAVSGGGWCGPKSAVIESGNQYRSSSVDRFLSVWRFACTSGVPPNAYALCVKAADSKQTATR